MKTSNIKQEAIINEAKRYSKAFIEKMGGFYPFAIGVNIENEVFSIGAYEGDEFPDSQKLIDFLERSINVEISNGNIMMAGLCIDIFLYKTINNIDVKKDAIEIRFMGKNKIIKHIFYEFTDRKSVKFVEE